MTPRVPEKAVEFVAEREDFRPTPYRDSEGNWTVGYGRLLAPPSAPKPKVTTTKDQAEAWLRDSLGDCAADLFAMVTVPLSDDQLSALLSWAYNVGCGAVKGSTLLRLLNKGQYVQAADQYTKWVYETGPDGKKRVSSGLLNRRLAEKALFLGDKP
jgi:GH24 family phage-related lysozyme (muramidase)